MNSEYLWWLLALVLAGGGIVAFLALGRVPEIEDETPVEDEPEGEDRPAAEAPGPGSIDPAPGHSESPQSSPVSTSVPGPDVPSETSETP
jgi:hypothetical protein